MHYDNAVLFATAELCVSSSSETTITKLLHLFRLITQIHTHTHTGKHYN